LDAGDTPATTKLLQRERLLRFFNKFLEARIAAQ
jgi:hypothetical protein